MPAKRNPKKSRKQSSPQGIPPNLDALAVRPPAVVLPTEPVAPAVASGASAEAAGPVSLPETPVLPGASATPPRSGPPAGRQARLGGRSQRAGQTRFYAFRRS
ncbi:hypothetical protein KBX03_23995 [Micromonospora sp. C72]|uniref:hypothetical protein n=1 Tax=unclassified Micromonospora TaxID=2617518 RepID=UPI001B392CC7|nr:MULTISPECIES: hypothetical protein [unclassified Micromonospora]MBQ1045577.1 hypothetical protein [Micromonospora sp. C72]